MIKLRLENLIILLLICILCDATIYNCDRTSSCGCGHTNVDISPRIIYGEEAIPNSWSMIVSLAYTFPIDDNDSYIYICGGTILTDSYILTSANCLEEFNGNAFFGNLTISAGIHSRNESFQINRKADKFIIHPNWTKLDRYENDIALVHIDEPFNFRMSSLITRTCLPPQLNILEELIEYPPIGTSLVIIGWGRTLHTYDESDTLQQLIVYAIRHNDTACEVRISDPRIQFCAGRDYGGTGVCFGDFGGPIFQWIDHHWEQVGIISINGGGCELSSSEGYTRVAYYRDWIESYISNNNQSNVTTFTPKEELPTGITTIISSTPLDFISTSLKPSNPNVTPTTPFNNNGYNHQHNTLIMGIIYSLIFIIIL